MLFFMDHIYVQISGIIYCIASLHNKYNGDIIES